MMVEDRNPGGIVPRYEGDIFYLTNPRLRIRNGICIAAMAELVDAPGSGSGGRMPVRVRVPLAAIKAFRFDPEKRQLSELPESHVLH